MIILVVPKVSQGAFVLWDLRFFKFFPNFLSTFVQINSIFTSLLVCLTLYYSILVVHSDCCILWVLRKMTFHLRPAWVSTITNNMVVIVRVIMVITLWYMDLLLQATITTRTIYLFSLYYLFLTFKKVSKSGFVYPIILMILATISCIHVQVTIISLATFPILRINIISYCVI